MAHHEFFYAVIGLPAPIGVADKRKAYRTLRGRCRCDVVSGATNNAVSLIVYYDNSRACAQQKCEVGFEYGQLMPVLRRVASPYQRVAGSLIERVKISGC